jgi:integrase
MGRGPGVRATGTQSIQIDFRYQGIRCRERLRLAPSAQNLKYAARLKATIEHEIAQRTFDYARHFPDSPRARRLVAGGSISIRGALLAYCGSLAHTVEPETLRDYGRDAEIVARWFDEGRTLASLSRKDIRQAVSKLNLSRTRISNLMRTLRGALDQALEDEAISSNPLEGFKFRRVRSGPKQEIDPFTPEEVEALAGTDLGYLWKFWAWTGIRSGELIGLQWGDVAADGESISVRRAVRLGRTKAPKSAAGTRVVRLLRPAREAIAHLKQDAPGAIFRNPNTGGDWHEAKALNRAFARACRKAQVRRRYAYQLRHTYATWALSSGENPAWIAKQMGHKSVQVIFDHYAKWMGELDRSAGSRMASVVESKATRGPRAA